MKEAVKKENKQYESGERNNNFGFVRLLSAFMVIVGHMYVLAGENAPMIIYVPIHALGVASFFSIGGYLITKSWIRQPVFKQYLVKRVCRIFPALIVCVLLTVFVVGPLTTSLTLKEYFSSSLTWKYMLNCVFYINHLLPGVFENNIASRAVNGSLWCLPVEFLMYLVIPLYIGIGTKLSTKLQKWYYGMFTLFIIMVRTIWDTWFYGAGGIITETKYIIDSFSSFLRIIPFFFVGSFLASCRLERYLNTQIAVAAIVIASCLSYLSAPYCYVGQYILIPYIVLSLALAEKPVFAMVNRRDISYGMFLSGHVIQQILIQIFVRKGYTINIGLLIVISVIMAVVIGFLIEKFVEKPMGEYMNTVI